MVKAKEFIEIKVYSSGIFPGKARQIVDQGVRGVISNGKISEGAKEILDAAGVWYRGNVEPSDLESEGPDLEGGI